jgi:hypothetical protein
MTDKTRKRLELLYNCAIRDGAPVSEERQQKIEKIIEFIDDENIHLYGDLRNGVYSIEIEIII